MRVLIFVTIFILMSACVTEKRSYRFGATPDGLAQPNPNPNPKLPLNDNPCPGNMRRDEKGMCVGKP